MQNAIRVPVPAVQRGEPGTYVYVINANNTVSVRPVKVGPTDGGYMAVLSGLQVGEKVVTDGTDRLRDGAAVIVPPPAQVQGAGASAGQGPKTGQWQGRQPGQGQGQGQQHRQGPPGQATPSGEPAAAPGQAAEPAAAAGQEAKSAAAPEAEQAPAMARQPAGQPGQQRSQ